MAFLNDLQQTAYNIAIDSHNLLITGQCGTGKTYLLRCETYLSQFNPAFPLSVIDFYIDDLSSTYCKSYSKGLRLPKISVGVSFHIYDQARFAREILPLYFKHSNIASFIRQLNMYGFRKVIHMESGAIKSEWDDVEFHHPYFVRGEESLLGLIKRKQSSTQTLKPDTGVRLNHEDINRVLTDVQVMKEKQDNFTTKIDSMKRENEALWREVASLRQKHMKQQQIVNKLIEFMIHLVGGKKGLKTGMPLKRKMPLMIGDTQQVATPKRQRYGKTISIEDVPQSYVVNSPESTSKVEVRSPLSTGLQIHDVTDVLNTQSRSSAMLSPSSSAMQSSGSSLVRTAPSMPAAQPMPTVASQKSKSDKPSEALDLSLDSSDLSALVDPNFLQALEPSTSATNENFMDRSDMNNQLDTMQDQIDDLKDLLSGGQYNFDPTTILGLFNNETSIPGIPSSLEHLADNDKEGEASGNTDPNTIIGNELVSFPMDSALPNTYPDLTDLVSPESPGIQFPTHTEEEDYGTLTIDPMSFVNLPGSSATEEDTSSGSVKELH